MKTELFIAWRYLVTKRKEKFISLISVISILGVAIGVMALIVVIAVMAGFDRDLRDKIIGNYSHITVMGYAGIDNITANKISAAIALNPHVRGVSPYVQGQVLAKEGNRFFAVGLKGINPATEINVTRLKSYLVKGNIGDLSGDGVIIGKELAAYLGLKVNSDFIIYSGLGKPRTLRVAGIFSSGMYDYDMNLMFADISTAQEILGTQGYVSSLAVKLDNLYQADRVSEELSQALGPNYLLKTWMQSNANFFAALKLEKLTMFIILTLIILVASFNIISTLIVMVVEKTKDIGILKAIGMTSKDIRKIFTYQGLIIGGMGIILGSAGGLLLCELLKRYKFIKLPSDIYYIDTLPVAIQIWPDIFLIILAALFITIISTVYPAFKAAGLKPVEALRYE